MAQTPSIPAAARRWERGAGLVSIGAGVIHGGLTPSHFAEWWGYGAFFLIAALAQVLFGLALITDAVNPKDWGPDWFRVRRAMYWAGILGNLAIIGLYAVTRTVGIPFLRPEAGQVEEVSAIDLVSKVTEVVLIWMLVVLLKRSMLMPEPPAAALP